MIHTFKEEKIYEPHIINLFPNKKLQKDFILSFLENLPLDALKIISGFSQKETLDRGKTYFCKFSCDYLNSDKELIK
jgi:hypothetical protein